ncbi:MAG TPA: hypothetical protein VLY24_29865 [Bryobacteraceae bacterium]|nr:hypothetical protein [Bryobacteraceae bacterium]
MDHLLEANKVASLMRRRENPKQIPLAQLIVSSAMEPRDAAAEQSFLAGHVQFDFQPLSPQLLHLDLGGPRGYMPVAKPGSAPLPDSIADPAALPFTLERSSRPAMPEHRTQKSEVRLSRASLTSLPCRLPGPGIAHRECEAALRLQRKAVFEFGRLRTESPGSNYIQKKRQPHLSPQSRDIPAQERASNMQAESRRPASRPFRCAPRRRPELPLARPVAYDLLSIAIFSDPRACDAPQHEQAARIRPLRVSPPITTRPPQDLLPLSPASGEGMSGQAQICEPEWKPEKRTPTYTVRLSVAGAIDFGARPPIQMAGVFQEQSGPYQMAEVPFAPPDSAFDYSPIPLHGSMDAFAAEARPAPTVAALEEDFNSGLGRWIGDTASWKLDVAGARPGGMALLEPSLNWTDYELEFLTRIAKGGVTFVIRASDINNYHRITIGPAESGYVLRSSVVIDGHEEPTDAVPAGKKARSGAAITVKARVEGSDFTISIDGEVVAQGVEERLPAGGIGFASLPGEQARLYKARLTPLADPISEAAPGRPPRSNS